MAMTSEEIQLAKQMKAAQQIEAIRAVADQITLDDTDPQPLTTIAANALAAGLFSIAVAFRAEALGLAEVKLKGKVTIVKDLNTAADLIEGFARGLSQVEHAPGAPHHVYSPTGLGDVVSGSATGVLQLITSPEPATDEFTEGMRAYLAGDTNVMPSDPATDAATFHSMCTLDLPCGPDCSAMPTPAAAEPTVARLASLTPGAVTLPPLIDAGDATERMSWPDFIEAGRAFSAARSGDETMHLSPSAIMSFPECGAKYLFSRLKLTDSAGRSAEMPAWWNVGGTAFHRTVEQFERSATPPADPTSVTLGLLWLKHFEDVEREAVAESGWPSLLFRTAARGLENRDWWRVKGEEMVRSYVRYHTPERRAKHATLAIAGRPVLEYAFDHEMFAGRNILIHGQIDRATQDADTGLITIRDYKSGSKIPLDTIQLGIYAEAVGAVIDPAQTSSYPIAGAYWNARAGSHDGELANARERHPRAEVAYRAEALSTAIAHNAFAPRVSTMPGGCKSCEFRKLCPAVTL